MSSIKKVLIIKVIAAAKQYVPIPIKVPAMISTIISIVNSFINSLFIFL